MKQVKFSKVEGVERFKSNLSTTELKKALDKAMVKIDHMIEKTGDSLFIDSCTINGVYGVSDNILFGKEKFAENWTTGFYSGLIWLSYLYTKNNKYLKIGKKHTLTFKERMDVYFSERRKLADLDHHDIGFLFLLSTKADFQITQDQFALDLSLRAADILMGRYLEKAGILQAWGDLNDIKQQGRLIIDCNLNVPLLYFAYEQTGNEKYKKVADSHLAVANEHLIREDASTFHTFFMDMHTGLPKYGNTFQGLDDDSSWARGQAWGIFGFSLAYKHNKEEKYIQSAIKLAHYFLNRLPKDLVCNWDLVILADDGQRDTSAAAIAAIGLLEIYQYNKDEFYLNAAKSITKSLIDHYMSDEYEGLVKAGVYHYSIGLGIDESLIFGDYYFLELLMRLYQPDFKPFWE